MPVRRVRPDELAAAGAVTVAAYRSLDHELHPDYLVQLGDAADRDVHGEVLVAVDDVGRVVGSVTYVPPGENPLSEHDEAGAASMRMLGVDPSAQRGGHGRALAEAVIARAREDGALALVLHSATYMAGAHELYRSLGFERVPALDWSPGPGVDLLGFRLAL